MTSESELKKIRREVEESREQLSKRWRELGHTFGEVAHGAKSDLSETVAGAREAVSLEHQAKKHPWWVFGGAIATGVFISRSFAKASVARGGLTQGLARNLMTGATLLSGAKILTSLGDAAPGIFAQLSGSDPSSQAGTTAGSARGFSHVVRERAVRSFAEIVQGIAQRNLPESVLPMVTNAIQKAAGALLEQAPSKGSTTAPVLPPKRVINDSGESVLPH